MTPRTSTSRPTGSSNGAEPAAGNRRPGSYILDIYGTAFRNGLGSWLTTATVIALMADLDVDEQAVRSSLSRMKRGNMLESESRDGRRGYALTDQAFQIIREGDSRIFNVREPTDPHDGWVLAVFSVPEAQRAQRHLLRSRLEWLGFGNQVPGVWIAPARLAADAENLIGRLGLTEYVYMYDAQYRGFAEARELVHAAWDLPRLAELYDSYIAEHSPTARKWSKRTGAIDRREAFVDFMSAVHGWRKFPYLDPGLPSELLLQDWSGRRAAEVFFALLERLEKPAVAHMDSVISAAVRRT